MNFLKSFSLIWSLMHALIMFAILFEPRYSYKKTSIILSIAFAPLIILGIGISMFIDTESYGTLFLLAITIPMLVLSFFLAKHRDSRFLFTFCMTDTIVLEIIFTTNIINYYTTPNTYIFMFLSRLIAYPLLELLIWKKFRNVYLSVQKQTKKGWFIFAVIGTIFYAILTLAFYFPTIVTQRPTYLPVIILLFLLMPIIYLSIFRTLRSHQLIHQKEEQESILTVQVSSMTERINEFNFADEKFRIERHDFRHKMQTLATLAENKEYEQLQDLVAVYQKDIDKTRVIRYCKNPIIDAVLSSYIQKAQNQGIKVTSKIALPDNLPVKEAELATVLANAIENAVNACNKLTDAEKVIEIQALIAPRFMIQISNNYNGEIELDENGVPVNHQENHGFGIKSIITFCQKYNAFYEFKADDRKFRLRIMF